MKEKNIKRLYAIDFIDFIINFVFLFYSVEYVSYGFCCTIIVTTKHSFYNKLIINYLKLGIVVGAVNVNPNELFYKRNKKKL